jgi:deoxyhypusine synthase
MAMVTKEEILSDQLHHIDLEKVQTVADLVEAYKTSSFQSRMVGWAAEVWERALLDPERPTIFLGCAGALIAGGLRKVLRDILHYGFADVIVTTGAIAYHDFYEGKGYHHYLGTPEADDAVLRDFFIDRVYDTYCDEAVFREIDSFIAGFASTLEPRAYSSREFMALLGMQIRDDNSVVHTAAKLGIPYFVPTYHDSSIGIGLTEHYVKHRKDGKEAMHIDLVRDNYEIAQLVHKSDKRGEVLVSGGVPKNYIQQAEVTAETLGYTPEGYHYAIQLTMDSPQWGGLSGCTFSESMSWGKIHKQARMVQAYVEATVGLPLLVGYLLQRGVHKKRKRRKFTWDGDELVRMD